MEAILFTSATSLYTAPKLPAKPVKALSETSTSPPLTIKFPNSTSKSKKKNNSLSTISSSFTTNNFFNLSSSISCTSSSTRTSATSITSAPSTSSPPSSTTIDNRRHWIVVVKSPPQQAVSKPKVIDYYVKTLVRVLGSEKEAQMCIYNASCETHFGFCCDINEETSRELACLPEVLLVRPDPDFNSVKKDYSYSKVQSPLSSSYNGNPPLFPAMNSKQWIVRVETPTIGVITKAQVVDYYAQILTKVLGNEKDAQMCIYHISWQSNYGFCCELDDECAQDLAAVPGVLSVQTDGNAESNNKDYGGCQQSSDAGDSSAANKQTNIKTKKLFVTGLSFYTSEKTLRAAFEGFGELVEVKIIMDKISKRSKGFAFIEYTTEEAASAALKEMNGKIINGWMIVVDVAKTNPPKYNRGRPRLAI